MNSTPGHGVFENNVWEVRTVKSTHRHAAAAVGILAFVVSGTPLLAQRAAQRGRPNPNAPRIVVSTFQSNDRQLGVQAAEELRSHLQGDFSLDEAYVFPAKDITGTLENSGYRPDSALSTNDLMELSKEIRGDETLEGKATKTATGVHEELRLLLRRNNNTLAQPLPPVDAKDPGDAADKLAKEYEEARKALPAYKTCENDLRAGKYPDAEKDGRLALQAYPASSFGRLCLLTAFNLEKASPDSIISAANAVLAVDPSSVLALNLAAGAYQAKGDKDKAVEYNLRIYRADPSNTAVAQSIVQELAQSGAPDKAIPIVDSLLKDNPGDPDMLLAKWHLQLTAAANGNRAMWKQAIATGQQLVRFDSAAATLEYFQRQIGAAQNDSNATEIEALAAKAAQKYPKEVNFPLLLAQTYLKAGQTQQSLLWAEKAVTVDPKNVATWQFIMADESSLNELDSLVASGRQAIAAGVPAATVAPLVMPAVAPALKKAQETSAREDWEAALKTVSAVDSVAPTPQTKFYMGVAAYTIGADAITSAQTLGKSKSKDDQAKACDELKVADDNFTIASTAIPQGASFDKDNAGKVFAALQQYSAYVPEFRKAFKCK
jgi:tetratricopeptide (TPR) repeat protein